MTTLDPQQMKKFMHMRRWTQNPSFSFVEGNFFIYTSHHLAVYVAMVNPGSKSHLETGKLKKKQNLFILHINFYCACRVVSSECFGTEDFYIFTKKPKTLAFSNNTLDCSWEPPISRHACGLTKCQVRRLKSSLG